MSETDADTRGASRTTLVRDLGLLALVATAVCNVIGGGINVLSVGIQHKVPGVGPYVPIAFLVGVVPALFAALAYAILASAMPRAGGGYIYVSRAFHPFVGFMATFSKWFGIAAAIGVIAYMDVLSSRASPPARTDTRRPSTRTRGSLFSMRWRRGVKRAARWGGRIARSQAP
jgi:amino acid transporter